MASDSGTARDVDFPLSNARYAAKESRGYGCHVRSVIMAATRRVCGLSTVSLGQLAKADEQWKSL